MKLTTKDICYNAIIAAAYVALTLISIPISYGMVQFRIAEFFVLLVFFKKNYIYGICLGTAIANLGSTLSLWDVLFGTLASALACICIMFSKHLLIAIIYPVLFNALIVGFELYWFIYNFGPIETFFISAGWVALGELVVLLVSYFILLILKNRHDFKDIINASQNIDFKF